MGAVSKFFAVASHSSTPVAMTGFLQVLLTFPAQTIKLRMQAGLKGEQVAIMIQNSSVILIICRAVG